jgi:hypothetical protein
LDSPAYCRPQLLRGFPDLHRQCLTTTEYHHDLRSAQLSSATATECPAFFRVR